MARYVVARRRGGREGGQTVSEALSEIGYVAIVGSSNPNIVVIETPPARLAALKREIGERFRVEPVMEHFPSQRVVPAHLHFRRA